jgi:hypothetical protein
MYRCSDEGDDHIILTDVSHSVVFCTVVFVAALLITSQPIDSSSFCRLSFFPARFFAHHHPSISHDDLRIARQSLMCTSRHVVVAVASASSSRESPIGGERHRDGSNSARRAIDLIMRVLTRWYSYCLHALSMSDHSHVPRRRSHRPATALLLQLQRTTEPHLSGASRRDRLASRWHAWRIGCFTVCASSRVDGFDDGTIDSACRDETENGIRR